MVETDSVKNSFHFPSSLSHLALHACCNYEFLLLGNEERTDESADDDVADLNPFLATVTKIKASKVKGDVKGSSQFTLVVEVRL